MATDSAPRETIINLRAPSAQRALIDQAAQVQGKSRTDFMLEAAYEKAQQVMLDRTVFALDAKRFERFARILDAPVKTNKAFFLRSARLLLDQEFSGGFFLPLPWLPGRASSGWDAERRAWELVREAPPVALRTSLH